MQKLKCFKKSFQTNLLWDCFHATPTELEYFILPSMMTWLPSELCVGAFWERWNMRLIRPLYYDCRRVVKCSVLSSIGLCHSEKYCIGAGTGALSPSLFLIAALYPAYSKKIIFLRAALLTEHSLRPSHTLLFFPRVSHRFWVLSPSPSLYISPFIHTLQNSKG